MSRAFSPAPDLADGIAAVMGRMREQSGGIKISAHHLGVGASQVSRYADRAAPDLPTFAQVAELTKATGATAAAEFLAELAGGRFVPGVEDEPVEVCPIRAGATAAGEASELIWQVTQALRDGKITSAEWKNIERAGADLIEATGMLLAAGRKRRGRA